MQSTSLYNNINSNDWASWLQDIAQHPKQHNLLAFFKNRVHYIDKTQKKSFERKGLSVQVLTIQKILEITEKCCWQNPAISLSDKKQMMQGIRYIHDRRQENYRNLFFIFRWFAKLFGAERKLNSEELIINRLNKELSLIEENHEESSKSSSQELDLSDPRESLDQSEQVLKQSEKVETVEDNFFKEFKKLDEEFQALFNRKEIPDEEKLCESEKCFALECRLLQFKESIRELNSLQLTKKIQKLERELKEWKPEIPHLKKLVKVFGSQSIKTTLQDTLNTLLTDHQVSPDEVQKDQELFKCCELESLAINAKRLIKSEKTQLSFSMISQIDRIWKEIMDSEKKPSVRKIEGKIVLFNPEENEIYFEEDLINHGSFKGAVAASEYNSVKKVADRLKFAVLMPYDFYLDFMIEEQKTQVVEEPDEQLLPTGSFVEILDAEIDEDKLKEFEKIKIPRDRTPKKDGESEEIFVKEAEYCLKYGQLPGIWPTKKVINVNHKIFIIQPRAGYLLTTIDQEEEIAISLGDMRVLFAEKKLSKKDQLIYLQMIGHFLEGVESLHQEEMIHRDLKPENILCSPAGHSGLSDLGTICHKLDETKKTEIAGSPPYMSPEMNYFKEKSRTLELDLSMDIWSLGLVLWECLSGDLQKHPVFKQLKTISSYLLMLALGRLYYQNEDYKKSYTEPSEKTSLAHLVWSCTRPEPEARPTIKEVREKFRLWAEVAKDKLELGMIQSLDEWFEKGVD